MSAAMQHDSLDWLDAIEGYDPPSDANYRTLHQYATEHVQGDVHALAGAGVSATPIPVRDLAHRIASTFMLSPGATLTAAEWPVLPREVLARRRPPVITAGEPDLIWRGPGAVAIRDLLAFHVSVLHVPREKRTGDYSGLRHFQKDQPESGIVILGSGVETHARALLTELPTLPEADALYWAAHTLVVHEAFHSLVDQARQRFAQTTGRISASDTVDLEEALAVAFEALLTNDSAVSTANLDLSKRGGVSGYRDGRAFATPEDFREGCLKLGRIYFGEDHQSLVWDAVRRDDVATTPVSYIAPGDDEDSAYANGAWSLSYDEWYEKVEPPPVITEEESIDDLLRH